MDMQGQRQLGVTQQQAWEALNDPQMLKQCVPGCDKMELMEDGRYAVGMSVKIGPVSAKFAGKIELANVQPPESYTLKFDGQGGVAGFGKGVSQVKLTPNEQGTMLDYTVNAQVGGKIAQLGQRLIDGVAKSMAEDFFAKFDAAMQEKYPKLESELTSGAALDADQASVQAGQASSVESQASAQSKKVWLVVGAMALVLLYFVLKR